MRAVPVLLIVGLLIPMSAPLVARQQHHDAADRRAASVMGFDQGRTTHHFLLLEDGGVIDVGVNDPTDTKNRDAIRSHLPRIAAMFQLMGPRDVARATGVSTDTLRTTNGSDCCRPSIERRPGTADIPPRPSSASCSFNGRSWWGSLSRI